MRQDSWRAHFTIAQDVHIGAAGLPMARDRCGRKASVNRRFRIAPATSRSGFWHRKPSSRKRTGFEARRGPRTARTKSPRVFDAHRIERDALAAKVAYEQPMLFPQL